MFKVIVIYFLVINILGYWSMGTDKKRAVKGKYRISEKQLFIYALLGGSLGSIIGMQKFRHKTKHWYFKFGMPLILVVQIFILIVLYNISVESITTFKNMAASISVL